MATDADRINWPTDRAAYETSARLLAKQFPDSHTYRAQVLVLDENAKLTRALALIQLTEGIVVQGDPRGFVWKHQIIANDALACAERKEDV